MERNTDRDSSLLLAIQEVSGIIIQSGQAPPRAVHNDPVPHCVAFELSILVNISIPTLRQRG